MDFGALRGARSLLSETASVPRSLTSQVDAPQLDQSVHGYCVHSQHGRRNAEKESPVPPSSCWRISHGFWTTARPTESDEIVWIRRDQQ